MRRARVGLRNTMPRFGRRCRPWPANSRESQGRWTVRTLARKLGLPHSTVHAILNASKLQLHRIRTFTFSPDPEFEAEIAGYRGPVSEPAGECVGAVRGRKARHSGAGSHAAAAATPRQETAELDQRIRPARNADDDRCPGDCHRQSGRSCPQPAHLGELSPLHE